MGWFCIFHMKEHHTSEELDACQKEKAEEMGKLTEDDLRWAIEYVRTHDLFASGT